MVLLKGVYRVGGLKNWSQRSHSPFPSDGPGWQAAGEEGSGGGGGGRPGEQQGDQKERGNGEAHHPQGRGTNTKLLGLHGRFEKGMNFSL